MVRKMPQRAGHVLPFRDKPFTFHDMASPHNPISPVLIRARALTGFAPLVRRLGGDPAALMHAVELAPEVLDDPERTLPLAQLARLLDDAAEHLARPDFGLLLSRAQDITVLGATALIARYSPDVAAALEGIARHLPYHTPGASLSWHDSGRADLTIRYDLSLEADTPRRQIMELSYAVAWNFLSLIANDAGAGWRVEFRHAAASAPAVYRDYFAGPVRFEQPQDALIIPRRLLAMPINPDHPGLLAVAERFVGHVLRRHPLDIGGQVAALIERQLAGGGCTLERVASQLGLHLRSLQRQLAAQNLHFADIIDRVRRQRAEEFLRQPVVPLAQVAALLGYSEQSAFNRACKRWFGCTPLVFRQGGGGAGDSLAQSP